MPIVVKMDIEKMRARRIIEKLLEETKKDKEKQFLIDIHNGQIINVFKYTTVEEKEILKEEILNDRKNK